MHDEPGTTLWARTAVEPVVRAQLVVLLALMLLLIAAVTSRGGAWFAVLGPLGWLLVLHARLVASAELRSWGGAVGSTALLLALATLVAFGLGPILGLYRTVTVLSGSMQPKFDRGDIIIVTRQSPERLRAGEVITFQTPVRDHHVETHRVTRVLRPGREPIVETKGDANETPDPWEAQLHGAIWRYRFRVPALGFVLLALRSPLPHRLFVQLVPLIFVLHALARLWRPTRSPRYSGARTHS